MRRSSPLPHRLSSLAVLLAALLSLGACSTDDGVSPDDGRHTTGQPATSPDPSPPPTSSPAAASPTPTPTASPDPTPSPPTLIGQTETSSPDPGETPTPTPTPRATPTPSGVQAVVVSPAQATLNLPAANAANDAGLPTSIKLSALVRLNDNTTTTSVTWSAASGIVSVSSQGLVTALATGTVVVTATSTQDPGKSGWAVLTIERNGLLDLVID